MTTRIGFLTGLAMGALALGACGGDDDDGLVCGPGTMEVDGQCVPTDDLTCAEGTVEMDGECVPDGSVICDQGTMYDPATGKCVPDITGCGPGTIEVDGVCVPFDDTLVGDVHEADEQNDPTFGGTPGMFTPPALGDTLTFDGCVEPGDFDGDSVIDGDFDFWVFTVSGPTLYDVTIDGKGGLSAAFAVLPTDVELDTDGWFRYGLNLVSDGAQRQIYLPKAGTYALVATDGRSLFFGEPAGGTNTCYFMQVEQIAIPAPTALVGGVATGNIGDVQFYSATGTEGQLLFNTLLASANVTQGSLVQLVENLYRGSAPDDGGGAGAQTFISALSAGNQVVFAVDHSYHVSLNDVPFQLTVTDAGAQPAGGDITITHSDTLFRWLSFNANAGDLVHFTFDGQGDTFDIFYADAELLILGQCSFCLTDDAWIQIATSGYHYIALFNYDGLVGVDYTITTTSATVTPIAVTIGTTAPGDTTTEGRAAFAVTPTDWVEYGVKNLAGFTDARVRFYERGPAGVLDRTVPQLDTGVATSGSPFGRIDLSGDSYVVTVEDAAGGPGDTFDFDVTAKAYDDLGTFDGVTPVTATGETLAAGGTAYYLVRTTEPIDIVRVTGTAPFDPAAMALSRTQAPIANATSTGVAGEKAMLVSNPAFTAFSVSEVGGAAGTYDVVVEAARQLSGAAAPGTTIDGSMTVSSAITLADATPCVVGALTVDVDISHTWIGDLQVSLTHVASGTTVPLHAGTGGDADDLIGTYPTTLTPAGNLNAFKNRDALGDWRLDVVDTFPAADDGVFNTWGIHVYCGLPAGPARQVSGSSSPGLFFNDTTPINDTLAVSDATPCTVGGVEVDMDITHTWIGDIVMSLTHVPSGTTVMLHNGSGGSADNIIGTYPTSLTPFGNLDDFLGLDGLVNWRLDVSDGFGGDDGTLNSWGVTVTCL